MQANENSSYLLRKIGSDFHGRRTFAGEPTTLNFLSLCHYLYMFDCKILIYSFKILFVIMYIRVY